MRVTEFDIAMLVIAVFGIIGIICEPWSPHPPLMVGVGSLYLAIRCAVFATAIMKDNLRNKNKLKRKGGAKLCLRK